jgi:hypothetical protein
MVSCTLVFVPSAAHTQWNTKAQTALDEIEAAHRAVGGEGRGRRFATLQVNYAYAMLLSSQFQGFCRDLHSEAADFIVSSLTPTLLGAVVRGALVQGRKLDQGNPNPGNLGSDFGRLGMQFWPAVNALDPRNPDRQKALETLNTWRNAIAHQDWTKVGRKLGLTEVRGWRSTCRALATDFDHAVGTHLAGLVGAAPW